MSASDATDNTQNLCIAADDWMNVRIYIVSAKHSCNVTPAWHVPEIEVLRHVEIPSRRFRIAFLQCVLQASLSSLVNNII